jgi:soluble lytic murein transglycosylase-like protein
LLSPEAFAQSVKYDLAFKRWGDFYFAFEDWRWFKCQGMAESNLNPKALSWCGAMGIMQIMPATAKELGVKNPWDPEESIQGGIKYDRNMDRFFKAICNAGERRKFMFAGYNAGPGNIRKAKNLAGSDKWEEVSKSLCLVTGKHCHETIGYVKRIHEFKKRF